MMFTRRPKPMQKKIETGYHVDIVTPIIKPPLAFCKPINAGNFVGPCKNPLLIESLARPSNPARLDRL